MYLKSLCFLAANVMMCLSLRRDLFVVGVCLFCKSCRITPRMVKQKLARAVHIIYFNSSARLKLYFIF